MSVIVILVLVSIALCITLGLLLFGSRSAASRESFQQKLDAEVKARTSAEAELEKRRKELDEQRALVADTREQLKQAKRKLFDQKESERGGKDLARAREEIERTASIQLESVRSELSLALVEIQRLKTEEPRARRPAPAPQPVAAVPAPAPPPPPEKAQRQFRELSDADREKIQRLEQQASRERARSSELDRDLRRLRGRMETQHRIYVVTKGELDLLKDKFKALEKRLNRTLLERDLLRRAMADLEKKTGMRAERTELTPEEIAASDRKVEEKAVAEAAVEAERHTAHAKAQDADKGAASDSEPAEPALDQGAGGAS